MTLIEENRFDLLPTFGLNALAALATVLGGCVIFSNKLLQLASPMSMAVLLSVSGGITLFQALVVLFATPSRNSTASSIPTTLSTLQTKRTTTKMIWVLLGLSPRRALEEASLSVTSSI